MGKRKANSNVDSRKRQATQALSSGGAMKDQSSSLQFPPLALKKKLSCEVVEDDQIIIIQVGYIYAHFLSLYEQTC